MMKKLLALVLALVLCLTAVAAVAESDVEAVKAKGVLVVGVTDFAPMDYLDGDEWLGFDADLARAFAATLGVDVQFVEINWDMKLFELNDYNIDCIWNGMTLTADVLATMSCTACYMNNSQVVVVPADKAAAITDAASLAGLSIAVEDGSAGEEVAEAYGLKITPVETQAAALMEVYAGASDAAIIDLLMAKAMVGEGSGYPDMAYTIALNDEQYGIGFRQDSDLTELCNAFLAESAENGLIDELLVKYGLVAAE